MRKNPMTTPNEIPNNIQYAGFAKRLKAFAFDYLLISAYIILLAAATVVVIKAAGWLDLSLRWPETPFLADLMAFVTVVLPVILYFTSQESSTKQATWGKRKAGLSVVNANGGTLTKTQAFVRSLLKFIPWQIAHTSLFHIPGWPRLVTVIPPWATFGFVLLYMLVGSYIVSALISKKHRTPYDWVVGSYVVIQENGSTLASIPADYGPKSVENFNETIS
jgi:uncharacterized RDD family membrane protein YckC